jgi:ParB-like chromosome segregation protein Spo0J
MKIIDIKVENRIREDYGNIQELANDIKKKGLIQPIVVSQTGRLIVGERRLKAVQLLGWEDIETTVRVVPEGLTANETEIFLLELEVSENKARKDFTPFEIVKYGERFDKLFAAKAEAKMKTGKADPEIPGSQGRAPQTRDRVGKLFGVSGGTYQRAKAVVNSGDSELIKLMNETSPKTAYNELKKRTEGAKVQEAYDEFKRLEKTAALKREKFSVAKAEKEAAAKAGISQAAYDKGVVVITRGTDDQKSQLALCDDVTPLHREVKKQERDTRSNRVKPLLEKIEALQRELEAALKEAQNVASDFDAKELKTVKRAALSIKNAFDCLTWRIKDGLSLRKRQVPSLMPYETAAEYDAFIVGHNYRESGLMVDDDKAAAAKDDAMLQKLLLPALHADPGAIFRAAHRIMVRTHHPDVGGDAEKLIEVNAIYEDYKTQCKVRAALGDISQ